MNLIENQNLRNYHTFATEAKCKALLHVYSLQDLYEFLLEHKDNFLVLGGGSNILFTKDFDGYVLKNEIKGIEIVDEDDKQVLVKVGAGENWHQFVKWTVSHKLWGLENLTLIPGSVGAAPMQNIGAYGVEQNICFHSLNAVEIETGLTKVFYNADCKFGYRESVFKNDLKGQYIITHVSYMLQKKANPILNYADVSARVGEENMNDIEVISNTIAAIRSEKLPDPKEIGNAGSFFKNPIIETSKFEKLKSEHPNISNYPAGDKVKLAAAWLIDQCGFKGKQVGKTGSYKNQALVIVNHGGATGNEIFEYAKSIQNSVKEKFDVDLEMEVNII